MNTKLTLAVFVAAGLLEAASLGYADEPQSSPNNRHGMMQHGDMSLMMAARARMMDTCTAMMQARMMSPSNEKTPNTTP